MSPPSAPRVRPNQLVLGRRLSAAVDDVGPDGRFPEAMALLFAAGVGLVSLDPVGLRRRIRSKRRGLQPLPLP
jgi:hypothetical protein